MQDPSSILNHLREQSHETPAIGVIAENITLLVAAACDMPDGTRELEAKLTDTEREESGRRRDVGPCGDSGYHGVGHTKQSRGSLS
jgi:hypothetical protein